MQKTKAQRQKLAQLIKEGTPVCKALLEAGWPASQARKGKSAIPKAVLRMLTPKVKKLLDLGNIDANVQEKLARGRLVHNTIEGKDSGSMSAKLLGSDKRVNMFIPDIQQGLIILGTPPAALGNMIAAQRQGFSDSEDELPEDAMDARNKWIKDHPNTLKKEGE